MLNLRVRDTALPYNVQSDMTTEVHIAESVALAGTSDKIKLRHQITKNVIVTLFSK